MTITPAFTERLRAWSYRRQYLDRSATEPAALLEHLVAVYSAHPSGPLTLHSRTANLHATTIQAWETQKLAVRIPGLRGSIFLAPIASAPNIIAATRKSPSSHAASLRYAGIDPADYAALKPEILSMLQEPMTVSAIKRANPDAERIMRIVRTMANEGLVLRLGGSLRSDNLRYVATESWLGTPFATADPASALIWLADACFRAFGPARLADFVWWTGCTVRDARPAIAACDLVDLDNGYLLPPDLVDDFNAVTSLPDDAWSAIPKWDAYAMGYAPDGRGRWIDDADLTKAFTLLGRAVASGDSLPLLLHRGRAVASWSHRFDGEMMHVTVKPFAPLDLPERPLFEPIGELFGVNEVKVSMTATDA